MPDTVETRAQLAVKELTVAWTLRQRAEPWLHVTLQRALRKAADEAEAIGRALLLDPAVAARAQTIQDELGANE
jgi:hypothetical protein